jgi:hypothetical protein
MFGVQTLPYGPTQDFACLFGNQAVTRTMSIISETYPSRWSVHGAVRSYHTSGPQLRTCCLKVGFKGAHLIGSVGAGTGSLKPSRVLIFQIPFRRSSQCDGVWVLSPQRVPRKRGGHIPQFEQELRQRHREARLLT